MTVSTTERRSPVYHGDGIITSLPFAFKVFKFSDLKVVMSSQSIGDVELTYGADYTVSLNADQSANPGGTVTLVNPLLSGFVIVIISNVPYTQEMELTNQGGFYPTVLNESADKQTVLVQQIIDQILNPPESQALQRISYAETMNVTGTTVHIDFPVASFVLEPIPYISVNGDNSVISWQFNQSIQQGASYFSSIDITFQPSAVGKKFSILVVSNG